MDDALLTLPELVGALNAWCVEQHVAPPSGQVAQLLTVRTARYYRTLGLLDGPLHSGAHAYGRRHLLQLQAIRRLQTTGQPLEAIQRWLYGRSDEELAAVAAAAPRPPAIPGLARPVLAQPGWDEASWRVRTLAEGVLLVLRDGVTVSTDQIEAIRKNLAVAPLEEAPRTHPSPPRKESDAPVTPENESQPE